MLPQPPSGRMPRVAILLWLPLIFVSAACATPASLAEIAKLHAVHEVTLQSAAAAAVLPNPFLLNLTLVATHDSSGAKITVSGFYDGANTWRVRFACSRPGLWLWRTSTFGADAPSAAHTLQVLHAGGAVTCIAPADGPTTGHGTLMVDPAHPHHFVWQDGTRFFPVSYECDWCYALGMEGAAPDITLPAFLDSLSSGGFNTIVVNFYANHSDWDEAPKQFRAHTVATPWASADQMTLNPQYWQHWDTVLDAMQARGIVCHMMIMVENKHVNWPAQQSPADDLYWSTIIQRFQAYSNVVWDVSKEAHRLPASYWKSRFALIEAKDSHKRLRTVHTLASKRDFVVLETEDCQFISHQQHGKYHDHILTQRTLYPTKPIFNVEFLYEMGMISTCKIESQSSSRPPC